MTENVNANELDATQCTIILYCTPNNLIANYSCQSGKQYWSAVRSRTYILTRGERRIQIGTKLLCMLNYLASSPRPSSCLSTVSMNNTTFTTTFSTILPLFSALFSPLLSPLFPPSLILTLNNYVFCRQQ